MELHKGKWSNLHPQGRNSPVKSREGSYWWSTTIKGCPVTARTQDSMKQLLTRSVIQRIRQWNMKELSTGDRNRFMVERRK
jgi:hypothetical protein